MTPYRWNFGPQFPAADTRKASERLTSYQAFDFNRPKGVFALDQFTSSPASMALIRVAGPALAHTFHGTGRSPHCNRSSKDRNYCDGTPPLH